jgi:hypothetical protein
MSEMIAYCGIQCDKCDTFIATKHDDNTKRQEIASKWSKQFNSEFTPDQINCVGCKSEDGPLFFYCSSCEIKKCATQKGVLTCAHCEDFGCETLEQFLQLSPENKTMLEEIRKSL